MWRAHDMCRKSTGHARGVHVVVVDDAYRCFGWRRRAVGLVSLCRLVGRRLRGLKLLGPPIPLSCYQHWSFGRPVVSAELTIVFSFRNLMICRQIMVAVHVAVGMAVQGGTSDSGSHD